MTVTEATDETLPEAVEHDEATTEETPVHDLVGGVDVVDEVLVEEISIDGMCGVY